MYIWVSSISPGARPSCTKRVNKALAKSKYPIFPLDFYHSVLGDEIESNEVK